MINETKSKIAKQIFEDYTKGKKTTEIVEDLNKKRLKTKQGLNFSISIIFKMLRNPKRNVKSRKRYRINRKT